MNLIERAKAILLRPAQTWPVIDAEPATVASIYNQWLVIMAAIPAVLWLHRHVADRRRRLRLPVTIACPSSADSVAAVCGYVLSLVMAYAPLCRSWTALAPRFGATKNPVGARPR